MDQYGSDGINESIPIDVTKLRWSNITRTAQNPGIDMRCVGTTKSHLRCGSVDEGGASVTVYIIAIIICVIIICILSVSLHKSRRANKLLHHEHNRGQVINMQ